MRIHLAGHLTWYEPQKRAWFDLPGVGPIGLLDLLRQLGVPDTEVAVAVVNGRAVELEGTVASDADKVEFFPPVGGGSSEPIRISAEAGLRPSRARSETGLSGTSGKYPARSETG